VAATLAWGRRGINLNASVWHLNVSRELLLDLRDSRDVKPVPAPMRAEGPRWGYTDGRTGGRGRERGISSRCDQIPDGARCIKPRYTSAVTPGFLSGGAARRVLNARVSSACRARLKIKRALIAGDYARTRLHERGP